MIQIKSKSARRFAGGFTSGHMMRNKAKASLLAFLVCAVASTAVAQISDRVLDEASLPSTIDAAAPAAGPPVQKSDIFTVNDNTFGYYYVPRATNPGAGYTPKNVIFFSHFDVWKYGTNYLNVEYLKATNGKAPPYGTPASPCDQNGPLDPPGAERCPGYSEFYGFFRSTLGLNQLSGTKNFSVGPLTNIELAYGADANTDNTTLASAKRSIQFGLQFDFKAPYEGFINIAAYGYKEWQHDGFASAFPTQPIPNPSGNVDFNPTWAVEVNYSQPLGFLPEWLPMKYKALVVLHGPKGCGEPCQPLGPGLVRTTEYLTQQLLVFDLGKVAWNNPDRFGVFGGYRWWANKFGITPDQPNGHFIATAERTWLFGTAVKF